MLGQFNVSDNGSGLGVIFRHHYQDIPLELVAVFLVAIVHFLLAVYRTFLVSAQTGVRPAL
jgi:hypothetical protein